MGAKQGKQERTESPRMTPAELMIKRHPDQEKLIKCCMKQWHDRTSGIYRWPKEGTFNMVYCNEVAANIKYFKAKNTSDKQEGIRAREREILNKFRRESDRLTISSGTVKKASQEKEEKHRPPPTAPRWKNTEMEPPPYLSNEPARGQFPQLAVSPEQVLAEGSLKGKFVLSVRECMPGKMEKVNDRKKFTESSNDEDSSGALTGSEISELSIDRDRRKYKKKAAIKRTSEGSDFEDRREYEKKCGKKTAYSSTKEGELGEESLRSEGQHERKKEDKSLRFMDTNPNKEKKQAMKRNTVNEDRDYTLHHREAEQCRDRHPPSEERANHLEEEGETDHGYTTEFLTLGRTKGQTSTPALTSGTAFLEKSAIAEGYLSDPGAVVVRLSGTIQQAGTQGAEWKPPPGTIQKAANQEAEWSRLVAEKQQMQDKIKSQLDEVRKSMQRTEHIRSQLEQESPRTLRNGRQYGLQHNRAGGMAPVEPLDYNELQEGATALGMYPLIDKGPHQTRCYVPWSFMDMVGLAGRLPALTEGANKWITALEESTAGVRLACGDIKALLMHVAGKHTTEDILTQAGLQVLAAGNSVDDVGFGGFRTQVWAQLRKHFPEKMDPSKLEGEALKDEECPSKFLHAFQRKWREETGSTWNSNHTTESLFKLMVKKSMPKEVQRCLDNVVGLMKMDWPMFSEHIVHYVDKYRKEKREVEELNKNLANKLTQLQLGELSKNKKEKEKAKTQAPVVTITSVQEPQGPIVAPVVVPQGPTTPRGPSQVYAPQGVGQTVQNNATPTPLPPIHVYVNPAGGSYPPRPGRGGLNQRGSGPRRGNWRDSRAQSYRQYQSNPNLNVTPQGFECWGCGQSDHQRKDCPTHPWIGPAAHWQ